MPWQPDLCHWSWLSNQCFPDSSSPPQRPLAKDTSKQISRARQRLKRGLKLSHVGRCSSPFFLLWFEQWEHSSLRNSCLVRIMETTIADKSNPASVGFQLKPFPSLLSSPTPVWCNPILMGHQTGETWTVGGHGKHLMTRGWGGEQVEEERGLQEGTWAGGRGRGPREEQGYLFSNGDGFYISTSVFLS